MGARREREGFAGGKVLPPGSANSFRLGQRGDLEALRNKEILMDRFGWRIASVVFWIYPSEVTKWL
jgi:hypothetical protein